MTSAAKVLLAGCLLFAISMQMCSSSAIPIWEFLTRNEKMSYLYSTFAQLVSVHCKATAATSSQPVNQCKRELLNYGYEKLQTFSDAQLEALDPYQRGANELIWSSIMREHTSATLVTTRKPLPTPPASSIIILTPHQQPASSGSSTDSNGSGNSQQQQFPQNPLFDGTATDQQHNYAMEMDVAYGAASGGSGSADSATTGPFLTGPLVIRVRPDGTPVEEDQFRPLPLDEDLETYQFAAAATTQQASTSSSRPTKHRKIATINALKQQQFAAIALQRELQPPVVELRRHFRQANANAGGYFYAKPAQA